MWAFLKTSHCSSPRRATVAYASRTLTPTEVRYTQIKKELLAIVLACNHFESYVFGRKTVSVETDYQPLVFNCNKTT